MAVIGARPVTGIGLLGRRVRPRPRPRPVSNRVRSGALRRPRQARGISGFLVAIAVAAALGLFYLSQSSHVAATGYQIDALQSQVDQLGREQQQLILRIGEARSPAHVEAAARTILHLSPIDQQAVTFATSSDAAEHATH
jgi:cell division protein FtsB